MPPGAVPGLPRFAGCATRQLNGYLATAAERFSVSLDPLCELGIQERHRLDRWLHASLPSAMDLVKHARHSNEKLRRFGQELGIKAMRWCRPSPWGARCYPSCFPGPSAARSPCGFGTAFPLPSKTGSCFWPSSAARSPLLRGDNGTAARSSATRTWDQGHSRTNEILTTDQRHFRVITPLTRRFDAFRILPADL